MFKTFDAASEISSVTALKSSVVRGIKRSIVEMYPTLEPYIEDIIPKDGVKEGKGKDKLTFVVVEDTPLFFRVREGPYFPTLHLLHQCEHRHLFLFFSASCFCLSASFWLFCPPLPFLAK